MTLGSDWIGLSAGGYKNCKYSVNHFIDENGQGISPMGQLQSP